MPDKPMSENRKRVVEKYPGDGPFLSGVWGALGGGLFGWLAVDTPKSFYQDRLADGKKFGVFAKIGEFLSKETFLSRLSAGAIIGLPLGFLAKFSYDLAKDRREHYDTVMSEREEMKSQLGQAAQMIQAVQMENDALKQEVAISRKKFAEGLKSTAEHGSHAAAVHHGEHKEHTSHAEAVGHKEHATHAEQHAAHGGHGHAEAHLAEQAAAEHAELAR